MSPERARQGWQPPSIGAARLELVPNEGVVESIVKEAAADSIHLCQGIRSNGLVNRAQRALAGKGLRQWVVMETVEDKGWRGSVKRLAYWRLFRSCRSAIEGVLATGWRTPDWVVARGVAPDSVFPFAYFLPELPNRPEDSRDDVQPTEAFRFLFVGQLIELKRVDLLIKALSVLVHKDFELVVVGDGHCAPGLRSLGEKLLPQRVRWLGQVPMERARVLMRQADCLVLPSRHDGWGAVVSEGLMAGTPVVCSDTCGSAGVVTASGAGGVFTNGDQAALVYQLGRMLDQGRSRVAAREQLARWAKSLGAEAGAAYLLSILEHVECGGRRPQPPWQG